MKSSSNIKTLAFSVSLVLIGTFVWELIRFISNEKEAFDSIFYFIVGLPMMFISTFFAGYLQSGRCWLFGISVVIAQPVLLFYEVPSGPLFMIGFVIFGFISFVSSRAALFGESIRGKSKR
jgi:hypothetical protein